MNKLKVQLKVAKNKIVALFLIIQDDPNDGYVLYDKKITPFNITSLPTSVTKIAKK